MYLRECLLENVGPITYLDLGLPFNQDGTPQPIILVGANGSGKSILLSYIADALIEFAKVAFLDAIIEQELQPGSISPYFRWVTPVNQRSNAPFGICLLQFSEGGKLYPYIEKTGVLESGDYTEKLRGRFESLEGWTLEGNDKRLAWAGPSDKQVFEKFLEKSAICYFPPSRKEYPHWLDRANISDQSGLGLTERVAGRLGKPIYIESTAEANKLWLLDVIVDSRLDWESVEGQAEIADNLDEMYLLKQARENVENMLKLILRDQSTKLNLGYRSSGWSRLSISVQDGSLSIPSLDNLSSGQSILFNLFATIIRYADRADVNKSFHLQDIEGIVLIDEIDAHLHSDLQYEVLPNLLKLFPQVQFILTSHSPLFLLGMRNVYGESNFQTIDMPAGIPITTERFSEFERSFEYYKATKAFEETFERELAKGNKPWILTEGETDPTYIKTALTVLDRTDLLEGVDIEWVGSNENGQASFTGKDALNKVLLLAKAKPELIKRRVLLLYDCDANKTNEDVGTVSVRGIPHNNANSKVNEGIENLFPEALFEPRFYTKKVVPGKYGATTTVEEFQKMDFCSEVCERTNHNDFQGFSTVFGIIDNWRDARSLTQHIASAEGDATHVSL